MLVSENVNNFFLTPWKKSRIISEQEKNQLKIRDLLNLKETLFHKYCKELNIVISFNSKYKRGVKTEKFKDKIHRIQ